MRMHHFIAFGVGVAVGFFVLPTLIAMVKRSGN